MPKTKNTSKAKNTLEKYLKKQNVKDKEPARKTDVLKATGKKMKSPLLRQTADHGDISAILKGPGDSMQEDIEDASFNPPLHSTAVYEDDEPVPPKQVPAKQIPPVPPASQEKSIGQKNAALNRQPMATPVPRAQKANTKIDKSQRESAKKKVPPRTKRKTSNDSKEKTIPMEIWSPEDKPRAARDMNALDVVVFEFEKVIEHYKETVETDVSDVSLRPIDTFFEHLKKEVNESIKDFHTLKELKRKNANMQSEIGRKRKRLIEVKNEILEKETKLKQLQKESSEQTEMLESLKTARSFLDNLGNLKEDYIKFKAENPHSKETFGISSLAARLVQAESILKAENHFQNLNTQLQCFIDKEREED